MFSLIQTNKYPTLVSPALLISILIQYDQFNELERGVVN